MGGLRVADVRGSIEIIGARAFRDLAPVFEEQGLHVGCHDAVDDAVAARQLAHAQLILIGNDASGLHPLTACWCIRVAGYLGPTLVVLPDGDKTLALELNRRGVDEVVAFGTPIREVVHRALALASGATRWLPGIKLGALELDCRAQSARVDSRRLQLPVDPPACERTDSVLTVDEIFRSGARLLTQRVRIRGALRTWGMQCTLSLCRPGDCCNDCLSWLAVGEDLRRGDEGGAVDAKNPNDSLVLLRGTPCYGDDSGVCCSVRGVGQDVIVEGILSTGLSGAYEPGAQYALAEPSICSVKDVRAHGAPHP